MQEPQRLLTRLNTTTVDWQNTIAVTGQVLKAEDIAACLAGLPRGPYLMVRHLWCLDDTVADELYGLLMKQTIQIAYKDNWACKDNVVRLKALVKMAMHEIKNVSLCKACHGTGVKTNQPCSQCNGNGQKRASQAEYARRCGVKPANWQRHWAYRYQEVYFLVQEWNDIGMNYLLSRL